MRIMFLKLCFVMILGAVLVRLFYWQVIRFDDLSVLADQQHLTTQNIEGYRGLIFSSDGAILASNKPTFLLYGLPQAIKDKEEVSSKLAKMVTAAHFQKSLEQKKRQQILAVEESSPSAFPDSQPDPKDVLDLQMKYKSQLSQDLQWVSLEKGLSLNTKKQIEDLNLLGIGFDGEMSRFYPEASMSANLLGFVGSDQLGKQKGYFGVEGFYNGQLKGVGGVLTEEKDAQGLPILMGRFVKKDPKQGRDVVLNLDRAIQYLVEKNLKEGVKKYGAKSGSAVVMDPKTGAILAMASFPNYDANNFADFSKDYYRNPVVADTYEPGSTFKVLVMASAINESLVKPDTECDACSGPVTIADYIIRTWNNKYYSNTTMTDVLVHSDNTGMVFISRKLGLEKMYKYIADFGFGAVTGIDLQDETSPDIRNRDDWKEIDLATSSFGQGVAVTPIQMVRAVSVIANGGYLMEPQVAREIKDGEKITEIKPKIVGRPISSETAKVVTEMMVQAVERGEAKIFAPMGFRIAGKTGTAQIPVAGHYDPTKTIASFVGFAPADNPKFVMLVKYTEPSSSIFGAETAAPTFFAIAKELLPYFNVIPSE
ncbi:MAG: penicillin-binding protein 2 [bacterium]|nr:penicillin-binding protein 2 [bacterium]